MKSMWQVGRSCLGAIIINAGLASAHAVSVSSVVFNGPDNVQLTGILYRPDSWNAGDGFSAAVMMHGCSGVWSNLNPAAVNGNGTPNLQNHLEKWGLQLAAEGVVALAVDSFSARKPDGVDAVAWQDHCSGSQYADTVDSYTTRVLDARFAWDYLAAEAKIDSSHIALMGWSHGAQAALVEAAETGKDSDVARAVDDHRFIATVVFYPGCGGNLGFGGVANSYYRPFRDVRMNMGESDNFFSNCSSRAAKAVNTYAAVPGSGHAFLFNGYTAAEHSFDADSQTWPVNYCLDNPPTGDTCAMNAADIDSMAFLKAHLLDNDGDGVWDSQDAFPVDGSEWLDTDNDGIGNNADQDDDGDGIPDYIDADPLNAAIHTERNLLLDGGFKGSAVSEAVVR